MKRSWSVLSLVVAMASGMAAAQTPAGTKITNQAEIIYTPETGGPEKKVPSNPVETIVSPVPSFTIVPNDGNTDTTQPDYTKPGQTAAVKPCDKNVSFKYILTNTGNLGNESYDLTNTPDPAGAVKTPDNIRFYAGSADTNNDGTLTSDEVAKATPITKISGVNMGQDVTFFQVYDIPCDAKNTDEFGGDPTGERKDNPQFPKAPKLPKDANNSNKSTVKRNDGVLIGPKDDADADSVNPKTNPYDSVDAQPTKIYPGGTSVPGTTAPVAQDTQVAIGKCSRTSSVVTFTNTVRNTGNRTDNFKLSQTNTFPVGTVVEFLDVANQTPITETGDIAAGKEKSVLVRVTYTIPCNNLPRDKKPTVNVVATSQNDNTKSDPTKNVVLLPCGSFGDPTPGPGGDPAPIGTPPSGTPGHPGSPVKIPKKCVNPIRTFMPMEIANLGAAADLFNLVGKAEIKLIDGSTINQPVQYYKDVNGDGKLDAGDTPLTDTNGDNIIDTGMLKSGEEMKLIAVLDVPCQAAAQKIVLDQEAKSPQSGINLPDRNNEVIVGESPVASPTKTVDKKEAKPGEVLTYTIFGKNTSNANVRKPYVCDQLPANTDFVSFSAVTNPATAGNVMYSKNGGTTWQTAALTPADIPTGATACVAIDSNKDGKIDTDDLLKPGQSIDVTFKVRVK